jgi:hypothetical protein
MRWRPGQCLDLKLAWVIARQAQTDEVGNKAVDVKHRHHTGGSRDE